MRKLKGLRIKHIVIISIFLFVVFIIVMFAIMINSSKKVINATVESLRSEHEKLASWLEEEAETYEIVFVPVKVADEISDYFTYVEDTVGNKYMITLPYDYVLSASGTSNNKIMVEHDGKYSDHAANCSAYEIQKYISENEPGNCEPIKCLAYKSSMHYVYNEDGDEVDQNNAVAIREFLGV